MPRSERFELRVSPQEKQALEARAEARGLSVSQWLRVAGLEGEVLEQEKGSVGDGLSTGEAVADERPSAPSRVPGPPLCSDCGTQPAVRGTRCTGCFTTFLRTRA